MLKVSMIVLVWPALFFIYFCFFYLFLFCFSTTSIRPCFAWNHMLFLQSRITKISELSCKWKFKNIYSLQNNYVQQSLLLSLNKMKNVSNCSIFIKNFWNSSSSIYFAYVKKDNNVLCSDMLNKPYFIKITLCSPP